jgi:two-component system, OmpR family, KDP operon response regulator KdpE
MSKQKARILVIDDDRTLVRAVQRSLMARGYDVLTANTGEEALEIMMKQRPDLVLLDLRLPGMSGLEVCKRLRTQSNLPPIIVISVNNTERDTVEALDGRADDYVRKPFGLNELVARIRVALRHAASLPEGTASCITLGLLRVDLTQQLVTRNEQEEVKLTPTEYNLLKAFIMNRGKVMTKQMLLTQIWGTHQKDQAHYLHVYIGQLRRKIEPDPAHPRLLQTITGVGYRLSEE